MARLNQILAIAKGVKSDAYGKLTNLHKLFQKPDLYNGFTRVYDKLDDAGEEFPAEKKLVQREVEKDFKTVEEVMTDLFAIEARREWTNSNAKADIVVDGRTLVPGVPIGYLLFLEKQCSDLKALITNAPELDPAESWTKDTATGTFKAEGVKTHKTKKVQQPIVMYAATPEHPAQTQMITEDKVVGYWNATKVSGAMTRVDKELILERLDTFTRAVKQAREAANGIDEVSIPEIGPAVFSYLMEM